MKKIISDEKKINIKNNLTILLLILACMALFYYLFHNAVHKFFDAVMAVFLPALIALFVSYICEPIYSFFVKKLHFKKAFSVGLTSVILIAAVVALGWFMGNFIYQQINNFMANDWPRLLNWIDNWAKEHGFNDLQSFVDNLKNNSSGIGTAIGNGVVSIFSIVGVILKSVKDFVVNLALVFIFFLYFLYARGKIFSGIVKFFPNKIRGHLSIIGKRSDDVIHSFVKGKFVAIAFLIMYFIITFEIIGLKAVGILFAILLGLLDIIPIVGPIVGTAFPMIYTFILKNQFWPGIWTPVLVLLIVLLGQFLQEKVISPKVIGKQMNINSLLLLSAMVFFSSLFGVLGIILAIPICGVIKVIYGYLKETLFVDEESDLNKDLSDRIAEKIHSKSEKDNLDIDVDKTE